MHRFYAEARDAADELVRLEPEDARHALTVLRLRPGDAVELLRGEGRYEAVIDRVTDGDVLCRVTRPLPGTEPQLKITLYQGLPKAEKMELIIQKAVELGAERVVPVAMRRCVSRLDAREGAKKRERWQRIAPGGEQAVRPVRSAAGGSAANPAGASRPPRRPRRVHRPVGGGPRAVVDRVSSGASRRPQPGRGDRPGGRHRAGGNLAALGGGCLPVTLGPRILRTETAGLAALSALFCLYGDMEGIS